MVSAALRDLCLKARDSADDGKSFFCEFAAKQIAIYRGLGYRGAYLGGVYNFEAIEKILDIEQSFRPMTGNNSPAKSSSRGPANFSSTRKIRLPVSPIRRAKPAAWHLSQPHVGPLYRFSKWTHDVMFTPGRALGQFRRAASAAIPPTRSKVPRLMRAVEHVSKAAIVSVAKIAAIVRCPTSRSSARNRNARKTSATAPVAARAKAVAKWMATAIASGCAPTND